MTMHQHYDQLELHEKDFVDHAINLVFKVAHDSGIPLAGDDRVERVVVALARAVVESRGEA